MLSRLSISCDRKDRPYSRRVTKKPRQRFTPWLHDQIEKGDIEGLEWINKEEGIFRVPWVRVDKPEFEPGHAELFKRWAFHTGKYRKGDQPDPSTWKTRFRCALRKMQEIKEVRELGKLEGNKPTGLSNSSRKWKKVIQTHRKDLIVCMCPRDEDLRVPRNLRAPQRRVSTANRIVRLTRVRILFLGILLHPNRIWMR